MSVETSMVSYYADRAQEYERIYHRPERQQYLRWLRAPEIAVVRYVADGSLRLGYSPVNPSP